MKKVVLFKNETKVTDKVVKSTMFYNKIFYHKYITAIKFLVCIFIIFSSILLDINFIDKVFCLFMSILGLLDTFKPDNVKIDREHILKYDFFDDCFQVTNNELMIEVDYNCIEKIIEVKNYYYFIIKKSIMIVSKNGFTQGNKKDLKKFIKQRM